jgi:hypothetical protein
MKRQSDERKRKGAVEFTEAIVKLSMMGKARGRQSGCKKVANEVAIHGMN